MSESLSNARRHQQAKRQVEVALVRGGSGVREDVLDGCDFHLVGMGHLKVTSRRTHDQVRRVWRDGIVTPTLGWSGLAYSWPNTRGEYVVTLPLDSFGRLIGGLERALIDAGRLG